MARMKFRAPVTGVETWKYKTGTSGGGFGANPAAQLSGAALTITAAGELGLAGANDPVDRILDTVDTTTGQCRVFNPNIGEIEGIITEGTLTVGQPVVGYSDTDRGKATNAAIGAAPTYASPGTPTVVELRDAIASARTSIEVALASRWVVKSATAGKANIAPRG